MHLLASIAGCQPPVFGHGAAGMMKLCTMAGATLFGVAGGYLATILGMDSFSMGSIVLSGIGSLVGVFVGWKVALKYQ